jgi:F420-non-reducing hydrogenase iron-sulfur subunit
MHDFEPKIVMFVCNWCSYAGADKAGMQKLDYSADIKLIRMMCSGRVDPQFVIDAFRKGADGVMVLGCHPGDCHYRSGNMNALKRFKIFEKMMDQLGIDGKRIKIDWVGAGEADRFQKIANEMTATVRELGPLDLR